MGFWEWAGTSDATAVITGIFGTGGLGGVVLLITRHLLKDKPPKNEQVQAVEAVAAPAAERDALHIARQALEASAADRATVAALQSRLDEMGGKVERVTSINGELTAWIRDVWGRWHIVRLSETPPALPDSISNVTKESSA